MKSNWLFLFIIYLIFSTFPYSGQAAEEVNIEKSATELIRQGDLLVAAYNPAEGDKSSEAFSSLYFDVFEASGLEKAIGIKDPDRKSQLESMLGKVVGKTKKGESVIEVQASWTEFKTALQITVQKHSNGEEGFIAILIQSFLILLREGFEAILVVTALTSYLRKIGAVEKLPVIYQGVGMALALSVLTAWLLSFLKLTGAAQEAMEGITMLIASVVLFYVSYWLISKRESTRWQQYIRDKINQAIGRGELFSLGFAAFLAVYREGAETILFYRALMGQAQGQTNAIFLGIFVACIALLGLIWAMRGISMRLPIGPFFAATAILLYYLAISFAGRGILELQGAGWVSITSVTHMPSIPWLGFFPTWESIGVQALLLIPALLGIVWIYAKRRANGKAVPA
ncbi:MAG: FTR1 family iron permease [Magnetococcus sp. DMHC-6]